MSPLDFRLPLLAPASPWKALLSSPWVEALKPIPVLLIVAPLLFWFFRKTWAELDAEIRPRSEQPDHRPKLAFVLLAVTLTLQEYFGGRRFFSAGIEPTLRLLERQGHAYLRLDQFSELYGFGWWVLARLLGYVLVPVLAFRYFFPEDKLVDMGLRTRGFVSHLWLYLGCLMVVLGAMFVVAQNRDFSTYYPFYKLASRSWFDLLVWEAIYFLQFFALEFYFRGLLLRALAPSLGSAAIFAVAVPYCMIHYGKPYLEANGAIIAGVVLGSLALRTRSIYAGFLLHITVAGLMDYLALAQGHHLPTQFWP